MYIEVYFTVYCARHKLHEVHYRNRSGVFNSFCIYSIEDLNIEGWSAIYILCSSTFILL